MTLAKFLPLAKADAATRTVFAYFDETPDRAREIFDYETSKPAIMAWSESLSKATDGKNLGNVRGQHGKIAAGKCIDIVYDDMAKQVGFTIEVVDDNEWKKVEAGVYTGISPGGSYLKKWQDGMFKRYTAGFAELSIVDVPCNPNAGFVMTKADGSEETIEFVMAKAYEPGNDATKELAEQLAKAAGPDASAKDYVVQARADLIAKNATDALEKMVTEAVEPPAVDTTVADALAKADAAVAAATAAVATPVVVTGPFADLEKAAAALRLMELPDDHMLKSMWQVSRLADLIDSFQCIACNVIYEANAEKDGSPQPQMAKDAMAKMGALLVQMAQEEVAEAIDGLPAVEASIVITTGDVAVMALATEIVDLVKADTGLMEKAGARNNKSDAKAIQQMHDNAVQLGAECEAALAKAATAESDNERLQKSLDAILPRVEALAESVTTLTASVTEKDATLVKMTDEIELLKAAPAAGKGAVFAVTKEADASLEKTVASGAPSRIAEIAAMPNGRAKADALVRAVGADR